MYSTNMTYAAPQYASALPSSGYGIGSMTSPMTTSAYAAPTMSPSGSLSNLGSVTMAAPQMSYGTTTVAAPMTYATAAAASPQTITRMSSAGALGGSAQFAAGPTNIVTRMSSTGQANTVTRMSSQGSMSQQNSSVPHQQHSAVPYMSMTPGSASLAFAPKAPSFGSGAIVGTSLNFTAGAPKAVVKPSAQAPVDLTLGIPNPQEISAQKAGYEKALDKQLKEAISTISQEIEIEKQMVRFATQKTIALFQMQEEEKQTEALALLDEKLAILSLEAKKALVERNLQLSAQANQLGMDYQMKFLQTELATKQYEFAVQYYNVEHDLEEQYAAQEKIAHQGTAMAGVTSSAYTR